MTEICYYLSSTLTLATCLVCIPAQLPSCDFLVRTSAAFTICTGCWLTGVASLMVSRRATVVSDSERRLEIDHGLYKSWATAHVAACLDGWTVAMLLCKSVQCFVATYY